ncbi:hypothetical protein EV424DRAFT_1344133 [Suillus variegatus]|nr:hypothetical protein EV424DRAFT_1344133 [Suillus variegatus]
MSAHANTASACLQFLPHGVPNLIYESPEDFGAMDFKLPPMVDDDMNEDLPLLENQTDLLCADDAYMGGVRGGLGLGPSDHRHLDSLVEEDELDTSLLPNEHTAEEEGLFAWFSDEEEEEETHEW